MIPKIIHLCWLSGDPFPEDIKECIATWKSYFANYEIWLWGRLSSDEISMKGMNIKEVQFDIDSTLWTQQAFNAKKYAFAADYVRLYALYNYGGIYLDSDVLVYKSFDDLLHLPYFIGQDYTGSFEAAVIGSEPKMSWIKDVLDRYYNRAFVTPNGNYDIKPLPEVFFRILTPKYKFSMIEVVTYYEWDGKNILLFHKDFFNSRNSIRSRQTSRSYCTHNYAGSWTTEKTDFVSRVKRRLPLWLIKLVYDFSHRTYKKAQIHRYDPIYMQK